MHFLKDEHTVSTEDTVINNVNIRLYIQNGIVIGEEVIHQKTEVLYAPIVRDSFLEREAFFKDL